MSVFILGVVSESTQNLPTWQLHREGIVDIANPSCYLADWSPGHPVVQTPCGADYVGAALKCRVNPQDRAVLQPRRSWICSIPYNIQVAFKISATCELSRTPVSDLVDFFGEP